jgi:hypothetical protein
MRHFLLSPHSVRSLPGRVLHRPTPRPLVPLPRLPQRFPPHRRRAPSAAVPLPTVATPAHRRRPPAPRTLVSPVSLSIQIRIGCASSWTMASCWPILWPGLRACVRRGDGRSVLRKNEPAVPRWRARPSGLILSRLGGLSAHENTSTSALQNRTARGEPSPMRLTAAGDAFRPSDCRRASGARQLLRVSVREKGAPSPSDAVRMPRPIVSLTQGSLELMIIVLMAVGSVDNSSELSMRLWATAKRLSKAAVGTAVGGPRGRPQAVHGRRQARHFPRPHTSRGQLHLARTNNSARNPPEKQTHEPCRPAPGVAAIGHGGLVFVSTPRHRPRYR